MTRPHPTGDALRLRPLALAVIGALMGLNPAWAQDQPAVRGSGFVPTLVVSETFLNSTGVNGGVDGGEFATRISPGFSWSSRSGRVQGSVNYALDATYYSERPDAQLVDNRLAASVRAEAIERFAFIDVQASIGQSAISATGQQFAFNTYTDRGNRTEVANLQVSPYIVGRIGGFADYQVRLGASVTDAQDFDAADSNTRSALLSLSSPRGGGPLGWGLSAQRQDLNFRDGRDSQNTRVNGRLIWQPDVDLQLFVSGGRESTDVGSLIRRSYDNYGAGGTWTPSPRTRIALEGERRYFGTSYGASFEYRTPRTIWRYSDTRGATDSGDPNGLDRPITLFDLFFLQFASSTPDPVQRELAVRDFLRLIGRDPDELLDIGALADAVSLQRRQELSVAWNGLRTTITLQFFATQLRALDNARDPAATPTPSRLATRERGLSTGVSYRLTPTISLNASATHQTSPGLGSGARNRLYGVSFGLTSRIARTMNLEVSARHSDFTSDTSPYRETALAATLNFRF
jgi:uncharacterized protein (PEP-CTERM system associated)